MLSWRRGVRADVCKQASRPVCQGWVAEGERAPVFPAILRVGRVNGSMLDSENLRLERWAIERLSDISNEESKGNHANEDHDKKESVTS